MTDRYIQLYSRRRTVKWIVFFQYVTIALSIVSGIILIPVYLKFIPIDLYGAWLATGNILVWLTILDPGISAVLQQEIGVAYGRKDFQTIREIIVGSMCITGIIILFIMILGYFLVDYLPIWLNLSVTVDENLIKRAFFLAVIGSGLMIFSYSITAINKGLLSSVGVGNIGITVSAFAILLTIILLYNGFGLVAIPLSLIFRGLGFTLGNAGYLLWRLWKEKIGFSFSLCKVVTLARLIFYTFWGRIGGVVANNMDLFVVSRYLGSENVAMLSITRKAPEMSRTFVERPPIAFMPAISHLLGAGEIEKAKKILLRLIRIMLWLLGLIVGGFMALNDDFVCLWVGPHLFAGQTIGLIICVSILLAVFTSSLASLCFALGNIKGNSIVSFVQALLSAVLVIIGGKYFGLIGVVIAPVIAILAVSSWYFPRTFSRLLKLNHSDRKVIFREVLRTLAIIAPLTLVFSNIHPIGWLQFTALVTAFCLTYGAGLYLISKALRVEIRGVLQKMVISTMKGNSLKWLKRQ